MLLKEKSQPEGVFQWKKRKYTSDSDCISIIDQNEVLTVDTDESDYETVDDYLIAEYLREQEEKENFEFTDISFGLQNIKYFVDNENMKKNDWIIAQFATKIL